MTADRITLAEVIARLTPKTGSESAAKIELIGRLLRGDLQAAANAWGENGSEGREYRYDCAVDPVIPLPIPAKAWATCDSGYIDGSNINWRQPWHGKNGSPWGSGNIDFAHSVHLSRTAVDLIWPTETNKITSTVSANSRKIQRARGPKPEKRGRVISEMRAFSHADLNAMTELEMEKRFGASRDTCRTAREIVLANDDKG
ncbi:MAG: hypothetical protein K2X71_06210 [Methylobacterium sp.]|uniref:hypothetical protein n=1 Tax=Methylobacterium sp. TaxID=409 RepID=UPI00258AF41D|nr:hypothetical protein [Methylobacterium sp.]MBY0295618.1 hypothetical protein [Methylobacterium sp.]